MGHRYSVPTINLAACQIQPFTILILLACAKHFFLNFACWQYKQLKGSVVKQTFVQVIQKLYCHFRRQPGIQMQIDKKRGSQSHHDIAGKM